MTFDLSKLALSYIVFMSQVDLLEKIDLEVIKTVQNSSAESKITSKNTKVNVSNSFRF